MKAPARPAAISLASEWLAGWPFAETWFSYAFIAYGSDGMISHDSRDKSGLGKKKSGLTSKAAAPPMTSWLNVGLFESSVFWY